MSSRLVIALGAALVATVGVFLILKNQATDYREEIPAPRAVVEAQGPVAGAAPAPLVTSPSVTAATGTAAAVSTPALPAPKLVEFAKKLEATQAGLATVEQIRALPSEAKHEAPAPVLKGGLEIGDVAEAIEKDPELRPQGREFYSHCAKREDLAISLRATCFSRLRELSRKMNASLDEGSYSAEVVRLVNEFHAP